MRRRPPRSTRTDTLVPDPRLFRALLAFDIAAGRGEVEPFMRLDQVDIDPARAGRKRDTEIEIGARIAACGVEQAALDQILGRLQTDRHDNPLCLHPNWRTRGQSCGLWSTKR